MSFNTLSYHYAIAQHPNYAASKEAAKNTQWHPSSSGHIIYDIHSNTPFISIAVVQAIDYRLNCRPSGNFLSNYGKLENAKYQLYGARPADANFRADFTIVYNFLAKLQTEAAASKIHRDMLHSNKNGKMIRFAISVFEKRATEVADSPPPLHSTKGDVYYKDFESQSSTCAIQSDDVTVQSEEPLEEMDEEMRNWKVDPKYSDMLDAIKPYYRAVPLRAYKGDAGDVFIEPAKVNNTICNALLKIHFTIHHAFLGKKNPPQDTFRTNIEQIHILKKGFDSMSAYHTSDPCLGPIKLTIHSPPKSTSPEPAMKKSRTDSHPAGKGKGKETDEESSQV